MLDKKLKLLTYTIPGNIKIVIFLNIDKLKDRETQSINLVSGEKNLSMQEVNTRGAGKVKERKEHKLKKLRRGNTIRVLINRNQITRRLFVFEP